MMEKDRVIDERESESESEREGEGEGGGREREITGRGSNFAPCMH